MTSGCRRAWFRASEGIGHRGDDRDPRQHRRSGGGALPLPRGLRRLRAVECDADGGDGGRLRHRCHALLVGACTSNKRRRSPGRLAAGLDNRVTTWYRSGSGTVAVRTGREEVDHGAVRPRPETFRAPRPRGEGLVPATGDDANGWPASSTGGARRVSACGATASSGECGRSTGDAPRPAGQWATDPVASQPAPLNACAPMVRLSARTQDPTETGHQSKRKEERAAPKRRGPSCRACRVSPSLFPEDRCEARRGRALAGAPRARRPFRLPEPVPETLHAGGGDRRPTPRGHGFG